MLKVILFAILLVGFFDSSLSQCDPSPTTASGTHAPSQICSGQLIFEDNFDDFDTQIWDHEITLGGGGNWEFEWYTNSRYNSWAEDGILHLKPTLVADQMGEDFLTSASLDINGPTPTEPCTNPQNYGCVRQGTPENILNPIKSTRIRTAYSFNFKYGKVEVRAQLPAGDWLWPAIWFLPRYNKYSTWPMSGEIDLMESRGNRDLVSADGVNIGNKQVGATLHWGPDYTVDKFMMTHAEKNNDAGFDADFHNYQLLWDESSITVSIDDEVLTKFEPEGSGFWEWGNLDDSGFANPWRTSPSKLAPFDQEFYLIINLAVGGVNYFPDDATNPGGKPWNNGDANSCTNFWNGREQWTSTWNLDGADTAHFKIDYVKVWAL